MKFKTLKIGDIVYSVNEVKKYQVIKVNKSKHLTSGLEIYLVHLDGNSSSVKYVCVKEQWCNWTNTLEEAYIEKSKRLQLKSKTFDDFVDQIMSKKQKKVS